MGNGFNVPKSAPPGAPIDVLYDFGSEYKGFKVTVTAQYYPGTGVEAYEKVSEKKGYSIGSTSGTVGDNGLELKLGTIKMPDNGVTLGAFIDLIRPDGSKDSFFDYVQVKAGSYVGNNVNFSVSPAGITGVPGAAFKIHASISIQNDDSEEEFVLEMDEPWHGTVVKTTPAKTLGKWGISHDFTDRIPDVKPGTYYITIKGYINGKLAASKTVRVTVSQPPQPSLKSLLMDELKKWYKKNVSVPGVSNYDWSFDVTDKVKQVDPNVTKAYLYGWYMINSYTYIGQTKPSPRSISDIVNGWKSNVEKALLYIGSSTYRGWYFVDVPCRLIVQHGTLPQPQPQPQPQPRPTTKSWLPLIGLGALLLGLDYLGSRRHRR